MTDFSPIATTDFCGFSSYGTASGSARVVLKVDQHLGEVRFQAYQLFNQCYVRLWCPARTNGVRRPAQKVGMMMPIYFSQSLLAHPEKFRIAKPAP
jgi:hypothetical protein